MVDPAERAQLVELVEDQLHGRARLLVGVEGHLPGGQLEVPAGDVEDQLAPLGLVEPAAFQAVAHGEQLDLAHGPPQAQDETVVGVVGVVEPVLVGQEGPEDAADLHEMIPVLGGAREPAQLQPQHQPDVVHGDLGEEVLEPESWSDGPSAPTLVLVDDQDPVPGPTEGHGVVRHGVLPLAGFLVVEDLLGAGLADVDDRQLVEMAIGDLGGPRPVHGRGRARRHRLGRLPCGSRGPGAVMAAHASPPGGPEALRVAGPRRG